MSSRLRREVEVEEETVAVEWEELKVSGLSVGASVQAKVEGANFLFVEALVFFFGGCLD